MSTRTFDIYVQRREYDAASNDASKEIWKLEEAT